jgi:hypothetical protein
MHYSCDRPLKEESQIGVDFKSELQSCASAQSVDALEQIAAALDCVKLHKCELEATLLLRSPLFQHQISTEWAFNNLDSRLLFFPV